MKQLLIAILLCSGCGVELDNEVLTGTFDVVLTKTIDTCDSTYAAETNEVAWIIKKESKGYALYGFDEANEIKIADSFDGKQFHGVGTVVIFNCAFNIDFKLVLEYSRNVFVGMNTNTLTMSCEVGSCYETWDVVGTLR